jgi:hypothetical protein
MPRQAARGGRSRSAARQSSVPAAPTAAGRGSRSSLLLLVAALAAYLLAGWLVWPETPVDDAYISFRYARNLAAGDGLVFNPGERVEGYSGLSWVLALAAGEALGLAPPALAKWLGLCLGAATLLVVGASRRPARLLAAGLLALSLPFAYHAVNGLETALAALLLAALLVVRPDSRPRRAGRIAAAALLVLTRPEGLLAVVLWTLALRLARRAPLARHDLGVALAAVLAFLVQLAFRWVYYGEWIANSARAKLVPLDFALPPGLADLGRFAWHASAWGVLLAAAAFAALRSGRGGSHPGETEPWPPPRALGLFVLAFAGALATSGGDSFPLWRFYVPLLPAFYVLAGEGLAALAQAAPGRRGRTRRGLGAAAVALLLMASLATATPGQLRAVAVEGEWVRGWAAAGGALAGRVPPGTRLALCPAGALPYHAGLPIVDMLGLTDPHIARAAPDRRYVYPGHQRHDGAYVLGRRPELVMLANGPTAAAPAAPFPWHLVRQYERDVAFSSRFRRDYRLVDVPLPAGRYLQLFARRDAAGRLAGGVRAAAER